MGNIVVETKRTKRKLSDETKDNDGPQTKRLKLNNSACYIYKRLFCGGEGSDVCLEAFDKQWRLHKIFLSKIDYFKNMFKATWPESKLSTIRLHFTDPLITQQSFEAVIECLYTDVIKMDASNTPSLMATASWFGMDEVLSFSVRLLQDNLSYRSVLSCLHLADKYNQSQLETKCIEFLARNILIRTSVHILKNLSCEVMKRVLCSVYLCVLNLEDGVYDLLKRWLYLKVDTSFQGTLADLASACNTHFNDFMKDSNEPFLDSHPCYRSTFEALRINNAILIRRFCREAASDNILPKAWLLQAYEAQWKRLVRVHCLSTDRVPRVTRDEFEESAVRCGRVLNGGDEHYWSWRMFDYGFDLFFSWVNNSLTIVHKSTNGFFHPSKSRLYFRYEIFRLDCNGGLPYCFKSDIQTLSSCFSHNRAICQLKDDTKSQQLFFSCRILRTFSSDSHQSPSSLSITPKTSSHSSTPPLLPTSTPPSPTPSLPSSMPPTTSSMPPTTSSMPPTTSSLPTGFITNFGSEPFEASNVLAAPSPSAESSSINRSCVLPVDSLSAENISIDGGDREEEEIEEEE